VTGSSTPGSAGHEEETSPRRRPRMVASYAILVFLLLISALLLVSGQPVFGIAVLALATILNFRLLGLRKRRGQHP